MINLNDKNKGAVIYYVRVVEEMREVIVRISAVKLIISSEK